MLPSVNQFCGRLSDCSRDVKLEIFYLECILPFNQDFEQDQPERVKELKTKRK